MATAAPRARRLPYIVRIVRARPRLFASALVGVMMIAVLPWNWRLATRLVVGWDIGVGLYLALAYRIVSRADPATIRRRARIQDEGQFALLVLTVASAAASIGSIIVQLGGSASPGTTRPPSHLFLAMVTIVLSWAFTHLI